MDVSRNSPCPCGSGKKYKRCCLGKAQAEPGAPPRRAPRHPDDATMERFQQQLIETAELPGKLGWDDFDFDVDLFDPVFDDMHDLLEKSKGKLPEEDLLLTIARGLDRHATLEVRARCAQELDRRLEGVRSHKLAERGILAVGALEDEECSAPLIGLLLELYRRYILRRFLARGDFVEAEEKGLDASLVKQAQAAAKSGTREDFEELARRIAPLGAGALPYIEHAVWSFGLDESIGPLVDLAARHPSVRSARILAIMFEDAESDELCEILFQAFSRMPDHAWPLVLHRVRDRQRSVWRRLEYAEFLVRARVHEVYEPLVQEMSRPHEEGDEWDDESYGDCAEQLARLGDRRAVGYVIHHAHEGDIPKEALTWIEQAWTGNGWWTEVREGLETLRRGGRVLVRSGEEFTDILKEDLAAAPVDALASANFRLGLTQEDWNRAYHEDLDWLRPCELGALGPRETELMQGYLEFAKGRIAQMPREPRGREVGRTFSRLQHEWMTTPQVALGGRTPLAVILEEKGASDQHPTHFRKYVRRKLSELCADARIALAEEDVGTALRYLRVVLDVEPNHPVARRLIAKTR